MIQGSVYIYQNCCRDLEHSYVSGCSTNQQIDTSVRDEMAGS